ncbi:uncharacterized protein LOC111599496 isoform X2 [Drosophila hydei]|uniref:Uncharacterized protein LOC111599496 isoform X2 n=1 Tax=Drosophila hydei TaxID=7224 RepID=A0A6J1LYT3_DROHY|nr:uncharacterized protein LOC111599496 isoform X2 [Drosophila hydei]
MATKPKASFKVPSKRQFPGYVRNKRSDYRKFPNARLRRDVARRSATTVEPRSSSSSSTDEGPVKGRRLRANDSYTDLRHSMSISTESQDLCLQKSSHSSQRTTDHMDPYDIFPIVHYRFFQSVPLLNWSNLHSNAANWHAQTGQLVPQQQKRVKLANAIDLMQNLTVAGLKQLSKPVPFSSSVSIAKHMTIVENRSIELMVASVRNFWFDNLELKIGNYFMHVDRYVFCHYMKGFQDYSNCYLELPSHKIKMSLMVKMYNWIIDDTEELALGHNFLRMYTMAKYMNVRYLLEQYWHSFSIPGKLGFWEQEAFQAYLPSRNLESGDLMAIFLSRIQKCFLPLVASSEFASLKVEELTYLLKLDIICVNTEDEVFFAALRWLEYDWQHREQYVVQVMATVRFRLISPWLHYSIIYSPEKSTIRKLSENHIVRAMLWHACLYNQSLYAVNTNPQNANNELITQYLEVRDVERKWGYCASVPHHHVAKCCRSRQLTYDMFKRFLNVLQVRANEFMDALKIVPNKYLHSYTCCSGDSCKKRHLRRKKKLTPPVFRFQLN